MDSRGPLSSDQSRCFGPRVSYDRLGQDRLAILELFTLCRHGSHPSHLAEQHGFPEAVVDSLRAVRPSRIERQSLKGCLGGFVLVVSERRRFFHGRGINALP